ncbi:adenosylcobinamide amidohydrolase [Streptomyces sp. NPDC006475]|uniref:adenosylcobinamide amidohydrolase n=1 Tax=Streptomyces sp. NPDC006475 TaxID=3155719 RepID=UPI0033A79EA1
MASAAGMRGAGAGLMTAATASRPGPRTGRGRGDSCHLRHLGAGLGSHAGRGYEPPAGPGTINIIATLPLTLSDAPLVNAMATANEGPARQPDMLCAPAPAASERFGAE